MRADRDEVQKRQAADSQYHQQRRDIKQVERVREVTEQGIEPPPVEPQGGHVRTQEAEDKSKTRSFANI